VQSLAPVGRLAYASAFRDLYADRVVIRHFPNPLELRCETELSTSSNGGGTSLALEVGCGRAQLAALAFHSPRRNDKSECLGRDLRLWFHVTPRTRIYKASERQPDENSITPNQPLSGIAQKRSADQGEIEARKTLQAGANRGRGIKNRAAMTPMGLRGRAACGEAFPLGVSTTQGPQN